MGKVILVRKRITYAYWNTMALYSDGNVVYELGSVWTDAIGRDRIEIDDFTAALAGYNSAKELACELLAASTHEIHFIGVLRKVLSKLLSKASDNESQSMDSPRR